MSKLAGYEKIFSAYGKAGRDVYVSKRAYPKFQEIKEFHRSNYRYTTVYRLIVTLNADPARGNIKNPAGDIKTIVREGVKLVYKTFGRVVLIDTLVVTGPLEREHSGLYAVNYEEGDWVADSKRLDCISGNHKWEDKNGASHYAAVAGQFDNLLLAGRRLGDHVVQAYYKEKRFVPSRVEKNGNFYSMYWAEKGHHKSKECANELASIIQQASKANVPVNWLVHGEGAKTFKAAAEILAAQPLATAKEKSQNKTFNMGQQVYFSNPSISSKTKLENLCKQAGMEFVGLNANNRDLMSFSTLKNVGVEIGKVMAVTIGTGGLVGAGTALSQVGLDNAGKAFDTFVDGVSSGNVLSSSAALLAVGVMAFGAFNKSKIFGASMKCTFGTGNQHWYSDDESLLKA